MKIRWRYGIIAGLFLAVFSLYPQLKMVYMRGDDWNGNYAYNDVDEVAYAAYVRALIDGRPRKNDPYMGRDDSVNKPQEESLFSIQFAAPYTVALPARLLHIPATWAMTIAGALAAFFTALAVFWLLAMMMRDSLFAMAGSIAVLAGGALFAGEGALGEITGMGFSYPYFPGFRRYIPAMAFPAFFLLVGLVWKIVSVPPAVAGGLSRESDDVDKDKLLVDTLQSNDSVQPPAIAGGSDRKVAGMFFFGLVLLALGYIWHSYFPMNKALWTSSYVLATSGLALLVLGACYWLIDIKGYKRWAWAFVVFGVNAMPLFVFSGIWARMHAAYRVTGADGQLISVQKWTMQNIFLPVMGPIDASLAFAISFILLWLFLMWLLYRKQIFLKV